MKGNKAELERYSFLWSEARLLIAALALLLGGIPVLRAILPVAALAGLVNIVLTLAWIVSGIASGYLLYAWYASGMKLFGGKRAGDMIAFFVSVVSGLNLGVTGLIGTNPGMAIASGRLVFLVVGALYVATAIYLWRRFKASGEKIF